MLVSPVSHSPCVLSSAPDILVLPHSLSFSFFVTALLAMFFTCRRRCVPRLFSLFSPPVVFGVFRLCFPSFSAFLFGFRFLCCLSCCSCAVVLGQGERRMLSFVFSFFQVCEGVFPCFLSFFAWRAGRSSFVLFLHFVSCVFVLFPFFFSLLFVSVRLVRVVSFCFVFFFL